MPLTIVRNDITKMRVDAIVNAANTALQAGGGVCGAIFNAAGAGELQKACDTLSPIKTGEAVVTSGFKLPAKYIIHAAGPVYRGGAHGEETLLRSCYTNALDLALKNNCESIAFPLISSGIYGYPKEEALSVATGAIGEWLMGNDMDVSLVVFDKTAFMLSQALHFDVGAFIDEHYIDESKARIDEQYAAERSLRQSSFLYEETQAQPKGGTGRLKGIGVPGPVIPIGTPAAQKPMHQKKRAPTQAAMPLAEQAVSYDVLGQLDEPFSATLLRLIDAKGKTDSEVYKRANIDRKLFSKIRNPDYRPGKKTAVALAVALELSLDETYDLLKQAGFALSRSQKFDVIVEYFITQKKYDIFEINNVLFEYDQPLLGG